MKMVKSLLLGSAAGVVAIAGAQAADLPVKAKPVQYVKICSLYGAGYYYIPGTDTCIKIGGFVRAEYNINAGGSFNPIKADGNDRATAENTIRVRAMITADARTQTEYGTLRSYITSGWNRTNSVDTLYVPRAFVQLGGFTWGLAQSFYDFYSTPAYSNTTNVWGADTGGNGQTVAAYTAKFGSGLSATLSLEDPLTRRTIINGSGYEAGPGIPDLVANLRIDQPWGSAQIMGALHEIRSNYYTAGAPASGHPGDTWGYAIGAGAKFNLPMLGAKDSVSFEVNYSEGALRYIGSGLGNFTIIDGGTAGAGYAADAVHGTAAVNPGLELTKGWSIVGGYEHYWTPALRTSLYGTYGEIDYNNTAEAILGSAAGTTHDWSYYQVGSRTIWSPVANLDLSLDVMYNNLNSATSVAGTGFATGGRPLTDQSWWQAIVRVQRNFYP